jgi:hypothetical protein
MEKCNEAVKKNSFSVCFSGFKSLCYWYSFLLLFIFVVMNVQSVYSIVDKVNILYFLCICIFTFSDGVVLGHPAGHDGVLAQPVNVRQCSDPLKNIISSTLCSISSLSGKVWIR